MSKKASEELYIGYSLFTDGFPIFSTHYPIFAETEVPLHDLKQIAALEDKLGLKTHDCSWLFRFKIPKIAK